MRHIILSLFAAILASCAPLCHAQTESIKVNPSSGTVTSPLPVNFPSGQLKLGNITIALPSSAIVGISDTQTLTNKTISGAANTLSNIAWGSLTSTPTTLAGYGITDPVVTTAGSYSDPAWLTLSKTKVGLSNADNTSDATKNAASVTLTNHTLGSGSAVSGSTSADYFSAAESYPLNKALVRQSMVEGNFKVAQFYGSQTSTGAGGSVTANSPWLILTSANSAGSFALAKPWMGGTGLCFAAPDGTLSLYDIPWSKPFWLQITGRLDTPLAGDADIFVGIGINIDNTEASLTERGIGIQIVPGADASHSQVNAVLHDGTTLRTPGAGAIVSAVAGTPVTFRLLLYSSGSGTWAMYWNGAPLGSGTNAPTGIGHINNGVMAITTATGSGANTVVFNDMRVGWGD